LRAKLQKINNQLEKDMNGGDKSINYLIENFLLLELIEKEPLRLNYIEKMLSILYDEVIEESTGPSWENVNREGGADSQVLAQVMHLRLKLANIDKKRKEDALTIM
jgi:hypothetical protein